MTVIFESDRAIYMGSQAWLLEESRELAWAEGHVRQNPAYKWILGRYVQADVPNDNGHIFPLQQLETAQESIVHSPLNMLHRPHCVVGTFTASELIYPTGETASASAVQDGFTSDSPFVEALAAFWRYYFPEEYGLVEKSHKEGALYYSMECVPEEVGCPSCERVFAYEGRSSPTYCAEMNAKGGRKVLHKPHFTGGALIIPPVRPGWRHADVKELSSLLERRAEEAEMAYNHFANELPHLESAQWEGMMAQLLAMADTNEALLGFSQAEREKYAKSGVAMPNGDFPIPDEKHLHSAITLLGRYKGDKAAAKAHIKRRAKALGLTNVIPDDWNS